MEGGGVGVEELQWLVSWAEARQEAETLVLDQVPWHRGGQEQAQVSESATAWELWKKDNAAHCCPAPTVFVVVSGKSKALPVLKILLEFATNTQQSAPSVFWIDALCRNQSATH